MTLKGLVRIHEAAATIRELTAESDPIHRHYFPRSPFVMLARALRLARRPDAKRYTSQLASVSARASDAIGEAEVGLDEVRATGAPPATKAFAEGCYQYVYLAGSALMLLQHFVDQYGMGDPDAVSTLNVMFDMLKQGEARRSEIARILAGDVPPEIRAHAIRPQERP